MGQITTDQSHQVMATLATNTNWDGIDFEKSGLQDWIIRNAQEAGRQFTAFLKNGARLIGAVFPVFKTIEVGIGPKTADEFRATIKGVGCKIGDCADDIFGKPAFTVASIEADVDLVVLTTTQLTGNSGGGTTDEVFAGAARLGLDKCAPDDGPQLRRQYLDQPLSEWLRMGMDPIANSDGYRRVFSVGRSDDGLWLSASCACPGIHWNGDLLWVFRRRK